MNLKQKNVRIVKKKINRKSKQEGKKEEGREDKNLKSRGLEEILKEQGSWFLRLRETACCHVSARKRTY